MLRTVQPELLDSLPPDHPDALHNRRDLRLINRLMGNFRWFRRHLPGLLQPGDHVLEIGAGTGDLGLGLVDVVEHYAALDLWARPAAWPARYAWHQDDLRTFPEYARYPVVLANLILHQFHDDELKELGARLSASARVILACEPYRQKRSRWLFRIFGRLLGANHVSLHDADVSIRAGFAGDELPRLLGLDPREWDTSHVTSSLGAYRMIAVRRPRP